MEETNEEVQCLKCKKCIQGKPWIIVDFEDGPVYGCSYLCANQFKSILCKDYWKYVSNKEDFNEPRPLFEVTQPKQHRKDITTGFGMDEIRSEIEREELRIKLIEEDYENESSDDYSDEENFQ